MYIYMNFTRCVQAQKQRKDSISKQGKEMSVFLVKKITYIYKDSGNNFDFKNPQVKNLGRPLVNRGDEHIRTCVCDHMTVT